MTRLQARAAANDAAWVALQKVCDAYSAGTVYPPNGNAYPGSGSVGSGYQGDGYLDAIQTIGLCYRTAKGVNETLAAKYAATGSKVLEAMSTPAASGGAKPSTDAGYGIRNYGVGMALGFDWLLPALDATLKTRVVTALNAWVDWYDQSGFVNDDPIANYFVGYLLAKTYTAIATEQDNPKAGMYWSDVQNHLWGQLVKPKYLGWMKGGGWPEGWGYGPRAVRGVAEFLWGVKTGKNLNWYAELPQARDQATYLQHFAWPSLSRMDDQGTVRSGIDLDPSPALYTSLATILTELGDAQAPIAASVAADVLAKSTDDRIAWQKFLYWDPAIKQTSYKSQPLSYAAEGPGHVAARSTWDATASWASLSAGRYTNAQDSGEQMFNAGGVSVVLGGDPVLVNATGWIPSTAGTAGEDFVYTDSWSGGGRRLYNTFFVVDPGSPYSPGQNSASPDKSKAHLERYDDGGAYVRARAANLEDQYGVSGSKPVLGYRRDMVYFRGGSVVLFDTTTVAVASADRWMAFHTPSAPTAVATSDATQHRYDVKAGGLTKGSLRVLMPTNAQLSTVSLPGGTTRIEAHAGGAATQEWLSVVTASASVPEQTRLSAKDGNVLSGSAVGVEIHAAREQVVLFPSSGAQLSTLSYVVDPSIEGDHVLVDVQPSSTGYSITTAPGSGGLVVSVKPGGAFQPSAAGVLAFTLSKSGSVGSPSTGGTGGSGGAGSGGASAGGGGSGGASAGSGGSPSGGAAGATGSPSGGSSGGEPSSGGAGGAPALASGGAGGAEELPPCE